MTIHPRFNPLTLNYDVAVLHTVSDFNTNAANIGMICLPQDDEQDYRDQGCFAMGWGEELGTFLNHTWENIF